MEAPFELTDEQRFVFDLKGWLCIPAVLPSEQIADIKAHLLELHRSPTAANVDYLRGPGQELLDHPVVVGALSEFLGGARVPHDEDKAYGFRCESSFFSYREFGHGAGRAGVPHGGEPEPFKYSCRNGKIYGGLMRVVWELNDMTEADAGTLFMSGSHKANFPLPPEHKVTTSPLFERYACPAGSVIFFSEDVVHCGLDWQNHDRPRVTVFSGYGPVTAQHSRCRIPDEIIASMPTKRQTLFRGTWMFDFDGDFGAGRYNDFYALDNAAV